MKPKRYVLFMFDNSPTYPPIGGWNDMRDSFDTLEELSDYLKEFATNEKSWRFDHVEVLDLESGAQIDLSPERKQAPPPRRRIPSIFGFGNELGGTRYGGYGYGTGFDDDLDFDDFPFEEPDPETTPTNGKKKRGRRGRRARR